MASIQNILCTHLFQIDLEKTLAISICTEKFNFRLTLYNSSFFKTINARKSASKSLNKDVRNKQGSLFHIKTQLVIFRHFRMPETLYELGYLLIAIPMFGFFAHIIAFFLLMPILYFFWSSENDLKRWVILLLGTPIVWAIMFYGSGYVSQFFYDLTGIGILLGAIVSVLIISSNVKNNFFENNTWAAYLMIFTLPSIGYFIAIFFSL